MYAMRCKQLRLVDKQGKKRIDLQCCYLRMQLKQLQRRHHHWWRLQLMLSWSRGSCDRRSSCSQGGVSSGLHLPLGLLHCLHMKAATTCRYHQCYSSTNSTARARAVPPTVRRTASLLVCSKARQQPVPSMRACSKVHVAVRPTTAVKGSTSGIPGLCKMAVRASVLSI